MSIWFSSCLWDSDSVRLHVLTKCRMKSLTLTLHLLLIIFTVWYQCLWGPNPQQRSSSWGLPVRLGECRSHRVADTCFLVCTFMLTIKCPVANWNESVPCNQKKLIKTIGKYRVENRQCDNNDCIEWCVKININAKKCPYSDGGQKGGQEQRSLPNFNVLLTSHYLN